MQCCISTIFAITVAYYYSLPNNLRTQQYYVSFKQGLKTWLFGGVDLMGLKSNP